MPRKVESERDVLHRYEAHHTAEAQQLDPVAIPCVGVQAAQAVEQRLPPNVGMTPVGLAVHAPLVASTRGSDVTGAVLVGAHQQHHSTVTSHAQAAALDALPSAPYVAPHHPPPLGHVAAATTGNDAPPSVNLATDGQQHGRRRRKVHIAVQGCCHGELGKIYAQCDAHERETGEKIDFLICCGDFQSVRNDTDLRSMAVPDKYKVYGDFVEYHSGRKEVPVLTLFIGGNHEASNLLAEEYYGGYVAKGIYYLGHSSVVTVCGVRIGALSGIFKGRDYVRPYPTVPYNNQTLREAYHVRRFELEKLHTFANAVMAVPSPLPTSAGGGEANPQPPRHGLDIMLSHDWPVGITNFGNEAALLKIKPFFADDIKHGALGNPHTMELLQALRPRYWMAAHLHCYFTASVPHMKFKPGSRIPSMTANPTEFVALDKCIHHSRKCLTFMTIEVDEDDDESTAVRSSAGPEATAGSSSSSSSTRGRQPFPSVHMDPLWAAIAINTHAALRTTQGGTDPRSWEHTAEASGNEQLAPAALHVAAKAIAARCASAGGLVMDSTSRFLRHVIQTLQGNPLLGGSMAQQPFRQQMLPAPSSGIPFRQVPPPTAPPRDETRGSDVPAPPVAPPIVAGQVFADDDSGALDWIEDASR